MGTRLMILNSGNTSKLENSYREGNYWFSTSNWDGDWRVSVTRVAVRMGSRGGEANWVQGHIQSGPNSGMRTGMPRNTAEQQKKH